MTIVGIVHFAAASTIFRELYIFQRGSKNIFSVQEQKVIISDQKGSNESEVIIQDKVADAFREWRTVQYFLGYGLGKGRQVSNTKYRCHSVRCNFKIDSFVEGSCLSKIINTIFPQNGLTLEA